jgi:hypothetical protein
MELLERLQKIIEEHAAQSVIVSNEHPETSHEASKIAKLSAGMRRQMVYEMFLDRQGLGLCDHELIERSGIPANSARPTRIGLTRDGLLKDSGMRRLTPQGNKAIVWVTTEIYDEASK